MFPRTRTGGKCLLRRLSMPGYTHVEYNGNIQDPAPLVTDDTSRTPTCTDEFPNPRRCVGSRRSSGRCDFGGGESVFNFFLEEYPVLASKLPRGNVSRAQPYIEVGWRGHEAPSIFSELEGVLEWFSMNSCAVFAQHTPKNCTEFSCRLESYGFNTFDEPKKQLPLVGVKRYP